MADNYPGLENGTARGGVAGNVSWDVIADEAVDIGAPVIAVAAGTGEKFPRVEPNDTQGAMALGVVVAGDKDGTFSGSDQSAADAAGEGVSVCVFGPCKVKVNANTNNLSVGSPLTIAGSDGVAELAQASDNVFGRALQASTADGDFILCFVNPEGVL
jgi:hypothetical protein